MTARVLVVDDIEANRRLMKAKLEAKYYTVLVAENGPQALEIAAQKQPQIILLDIMMPGMDGYEVCRRLKVSSATRHIPVVMLTALSERDDRLRGLEAGADDFLSKPVEDFALMARLEALSRYNAVADELRSREAANPYGASLSEDEQATLDKPASVLLIDQQTETAVGLAKALEEVGHKSSVWGTSAKGQDQLKGIDLLVLALSDQGYDALRLCARLRSINGARGFSILVTYDPCDEKKASEALRLGASDMICSPVDTQEFQARVRTQLRRKRYIEILRRRVDRGLELSIIDQLTGLYNRRYMLEQLQRWMKRSQVGGKPVSIVAFDIDHFKRINDAHGHEAGDRVLQKFAERIRTNIRPKDIACRPGGEEFLVIMPETPADLACVAAERIRHAIANKPFSVKRTGEDVSVTVSAGVATHYGEEGILADFLHSADQALYRAKQKGRNRTENLAA